MSEAFWGDKPASNQHTIGDQRKVALFLRSFQM